MMQTRSFHPAFTLLEIIAVIAIMAIVAMAAVLTLAHTVSSHRDQSIGDELEQADGLVRSAARAGGKVQHLVLDLSQSEVLWQTPGEPQAARLIKLPPGWRMQLRLEDQTITSGRISIDYSASGYSKTYALELQSPRESSDEKPHWMIVAGLTGQILWTSDDKQVDDIFKILQGVTPETRSSGSPEIPQAGPDAH